MTILVAEDNDHLLKVISDKIKFITKNGVLQASGGVKALSILLENKDDISAVITDVQMPAGSGIGLLEGIRDLGEPYPRCYIHSGYCFFPISGEEKDLREWVPANFSFAEYHRKTEFPDVIVDFLRPFCV